MLRTPLFSRAGLVSSVFSSSCTATRQAVVSSPMAAAPVSLSAIRFGGGINDANPSFIREIKLDAAATPFVHKRSGFQYEGSAKASEVGARNEAAFINYKPFTPDWTHDPNAAFAMPHIVNLLTVAPISVALTFLSAFFWGVSMWRIYASTNFRAVIIERPAEL